MTNEFEKATGGAYRPRRAHSHPLRAARRDAALFRLHHPRDSFTKAYLLDTLTGQLTFLGYDPDRLRTAQAYRLVKFDGLLPRRVA